MRAALTFVSYDALFRANAARSRSCSNLHRLMRDDDAVDAAAAAAVEAAYEVRSSGSGTCSNECGAKPMTHMQIAANERCFVDRAR